MSKRRPLVCDIDGVLADWLGPAVDRLNARYGARVDPREVTAWKMAPFWGDPPDWSEAFGELADPGFLRELPLYLPALTMLRKVRGMVGSVHIVTAREKSSEGATRLWLDHYGIPYDRLAFTYDKALYCKNAGASHIIEDAGHHAAACHTLGVGVFLVDQPYNRDLTERGGIWRVRHHAEIPPLLAQDLKERS